MSACADKQLLLNALADGELDAANSATIEAHVKGCAGCAAEIDAIAAVRQRLAVDLPRYAAPAGLQTRVETMLADATIPDAAAAGSVMARPPRTGRWFAGGALTALAASLTLFLALPQLTATGIEDQLIASHVRSLLATHLTDVATSDRHVVRPWFNGKIDFAPPVVDLAAQGFPLAGGRLDYVDGRVVPALVYHRRLHSINLFIQPGGATPLTDSRKGYSLTRWADGGLEYWAVSDIPTAELEQFHLLFQQQSNQAPMR